MYKTLSPGAIGLSPENLDSALILASVGGFQGLEVNVGEIADLLEKEGAITVRERFTVAGIRAAAWGLPIDWRSSARELEARIGAASAPGVGRSRCRGADRTSTYILSWSDTLPYQENLSVSYRALYPHRRNPQSLWNIAWDWDPGPKTLYDGKAHPFIKDMETMLEMAAEIGPNVGILLDCFHWFTSHAGVEELLTLTPEQKWCMFTSTMPRKAFQSTSSLMECGDFPERQGRSSILPWGFTECAAENRAMTDP